MEVAVAIRYVSSFATSFFQIQTTFKRIHACQWINGKTYDSANCHLFVTMSNLPLNNCAIPFYKWKTSGDIECTFVGYIAAHYKPYCDFSGAFGLMNYIFKWYRLTSTIIVTKWGGVAMRSYENGEAWRSGLIFDKREIGEGYYTNFHHSLVPQFPQIRNLLGITGI